MKRVVGVVIRDEGDRNSVNYKYEVLFHSVLYKNNHKFVGCTKCSYATKDLKECKVFL